MRVVVQAEFKFLGFIKRQDNWYIAHCPALDITTQGRNESEAKKNLAEASELFVVSCFERGTFEQAMRELGWQIAEGAATRPARTRPAALPQGGFSFPVPIPFTREKTAECPA